MKSTIVSEITDVDEIQHDEEEVKSSAFACNQTPLSVDDRPKNAENYFELLKALYENSSLLNRIKDIQEQSCERKFESFKENIVANQVGNNENSNKQQQVPRKSININIKNESDNAMSKTVGGERSLGNIIINSLDVSINVAGKANYDGNYGNINKVRISCSTTPKRKVASPLASPDTQLVTSSSSEPGDEENSYGNGPTASPAKNGNNNLAAHNANDGPTRAVYSNRVETVPDDISFDYHKIKYSDDDDDKHTTSTTCNNNSTKYPNGEDDAGDYRAKSGASIDTVRCNKHNNQSTGDIRPITSTYLLMTRSMGLTDEDALNLVSLLFPFHNFLKWILRSMLTKPSS